MAFAYLALLSVGHRINFAQMAQNRPNRITELRNAAGLSLEEVAEKTGFSPSYVSRLERGARNLSVKQLEAFARVLGVAPSDLLAASPARMIPIVGYVGAGHELHPIDDHALGGGLEEIECPWDELGHSAVAVRVRGDSMAPAYYNNDLIFYERQDTDFTHLLGKECVVALADGRKFIKQLRRTATGEWYLHSHNAEPILGVQIEWVARVRLIARAD